MNVTGIILAGGQGRRFGGDKALYRYMGKSLVEHSIEALEPLCSELLLSANQPGSFSFTQKTIVPDVFPNCGPLGGMYSCLLRSASDDNLVVPCDMPGIKTELLAALLAPKADYQAVVPLNHGVMEPMVCYLHRSAIGKIKEALENKQYRLSKLFENLNCCYVETSTLGCYSSALFANINRVSDMEQFKTLNP
jgi:molybdenum cofactor guanylyltransferase